MAETLIDIRLPGRRPVYLGRMEGDTATVMAQLRSEGIYVEANGPGAVCIWGYSEPPACYRRNKKKGS